MTLTTKSTPSPMHLNTRMPHEGALQEALPTALGGTSKMTSEDVFDRGTFPSNRGSQGLMTSPSTIMTQPGFSEQSGFDGPVMTQPGFFESPGMNSPVQTQPGFFESPGVDSPVRAQPGFFELPSIGDIFSGGFERARNVFQGPIEVSEDIELASGLPAGRNHVNGQPGWDGAGDALKHVTHAALIHYIEPRVSPHLLQTKEYFQGNHAPVASTMDRHNNRVGFRIGQEARNLVAGGLLSEENVSTFIINRVIHEFEIAQSKGPNGDRDGTGPYWERNHGFSNLNEAAPGWQTRTRQTMVRNGDYALFHRLPAVLRD